MLKRAFDIIAAALGLLITSPLLISGIILVWLQDFKSPFYRAPRVGRFGQSFTMLKLRSMVIKADSTGVSSTSTSDSRITAVGHFIRKFKLDELTQLWNVLCGDMSLVGPRPQIKEGGTDLYTEREKRLLSLRPGITDLASIIFSDEGDILNKSADPDGDYNRLIRPWKSRLALLYVDRRSLWLDLKIIFITVIAIVSKARAIQLVNQILKDFEADSELVIVALRQAPLYSAPPP